MCKEFRSRQLQAQTDACCFASLFPMSLCWDPRNERRQRKCLVFSCWLQQELVLDVAMCSVWGADIISPVSSSQLWLYPHPACFIQFLVYILAVGVLMLGLHPSSLSNISTCLGQNESWCWASLGVTRPERDTWRGECWRDKLRVTPVTRDGVRNGNEDHYYQNT